MNVMFETKRVLLLALGLAAGAAGAAEKIRVACIGDSITCGYGLAARASDCYPHQLQLLLDAKFPGRYEVRNFGNSGRGVYLDSLRGSEKRGYRWMREHGDALAFRPNIVICNLGINDCGEYIREYTGGRRRGQFVRDYLTLLADYAELPTKPKLYIWTKLSPLAEGHRLHRDPEPFLMQADLAEVARRGPATGIDMFAPLRGAMDRVLARDGIHPDSAGAKIVAGATFEALTRRETARAVELPADIAKSCEVWLCAGQSNMQKGWDEFRATPEEKARAAAELAQLAAVDIRFWDVNDGSWRRLTPANGGAKSAFGVSFCIRRAKAAGKPVCLLYVAAGGAPAEAFLSEQVMCAVGSDGRPVYPNLCRIATNRHAIDANDDFPCLWCRREYSRRKGKAAEAGWWQTSLLYDRGLSRLLHLPLTGVLWYQGESNATTNVKPDEPLAGDYLLETNLAVIDQLRGERKIPFVMMGLPRMNRPWGPYRAAQKKACEAKGAIFVDTFAAGLGTPDDVHPRDKIPFAELAMEAVGGGRRIE